MVAIDHWTGGSGSRLDSQNLDAGTPPPDTIGQNHAKIPTTVIIPIVIITIAILIPLWLCLRKMQGSERVMPLYRQDHGVEKPKLCEVALMGTSRGGHIMSAPWRQLRVSPSASPAPVNHLSGPPF
ncbi:hypothetical protein K466DRAFT_602629 [Polyporus arcularius HHB13444]|uniref:Uncharacterized protein n=1 Tax=Polyporus arcularius HHB13444 TaxID=1314778 RepID=A0A5C3P369_9APHY|nr:hypothetical protein K466DRAFT_602629 [Polyporus arcularius HHB13444]